MSFKNIKTAPLLLSLSVAALSGAAFTPRSDAAQLNFNSPAESVDGADFAVPYDPTLLEAGLVEPASQDSEFAGFSCDFSPEGFESEVQPDAEVLSHLGPNLVAQAGPFDIGQFSAPDASQGAIIGEMCELEGANIGGGPGGFNPLALLGAAPLGFLGLLGGGDDPATVTPPVPEPIAAPFLFALFGVGGVVARKRFNSSNTKED